MQTVITLPSYTILAQQKDHQHIIVKIIKSGSQLTYKQSIIQHEERCKQLFETFETISYFLEHLKNPQNSSFSFQTSELIINTTGTVGKNRKYLQLFRLKFQQQISLSQIVSACQKQQNLSQAQLKSFLCSLSRKVQEYVKSSNSETQKDQRSATEYLGQKFEKESNRIIKANEQFRLSLEQSFLCCRTQIYNVVQIYEQKLLQFEVSLAEKLQKVRSEYEKEVNELRNSLKGNKQIEKIKESVIKVEQVFNKEKFNVQNEKLQILEKRENQKFLNKNEQSVLKKQKNGQQLMQTALTEMFYSQISIKLRLADKSVTRLKLKTTFDDDVDIFDDDIRQFGIVISSFKSLVQLDLSFNHALLDGQCWDDLVNSLNGLGSLRKVTIRVQKRNPVKDRNWVKRLKRSVETTILKE